MQTTTIRPFSFDRIFTLGEAEQPALDARELQLKLQALESELARMQQNQEAMLAAARADAFEAGLNQARTEQETAILAATDALHAGIEAIDSRWQEVEARLTSEATEVALASGEILAGKTLELAPGAAIDEAIGRALGQVARGTELRVRVHPDLVARIEELVAIRQSGDRRRLNITVRADASLALGDAMIGWDEGGLVLDAAARAAAVRGELEALLKAA